ncbi:MAG: BamA/TamA family outer membrane protein [Rhodothermales bacterium]
MRLLALAALLLVPHAAEAQGFRTFNDRNHPEIDWQVAETEHFEIVYPERLAGIEAEAAAVAEETYAALAENLGVTFDKPIRVYLSDEDEIANGVAFSVGAGFTNIWVHVNETADIWTGDVKWLRKVMAHEIAHIFHYRAIRSPIGLLQNIFANPIPSFWAEGFAQYQTEEWDAQRGDRWLRTAVFEDRLSYADGTSSWNGRLKYAVGNAQVRYLADTYGDTTLVNILEHRKRLLPGVRVHDFYSAFEAEVGTPYREFYDEWRKHVNVYYNTLAGQMERTDSLGTALKIPGAYLYDVRYSPDTSKVAALVLSSVARPVRRLAVIEGLADTTQARKVRVLAEGSIEAPFAWSRDGERIAYARTVRGRYGSLVNDLFVVDVATGYTERLTYDRRASSPAFGPDGSVAFIGSAGGTANVFVRAADGAETRLTDFTGDVQLTTLRASPDGRRLAFARFGPTGERDLVVFDFDTGDLISVSAGDADDRIPVWSYDGTRLAFTSLRDDAPNVFVVDLAPPLLSHRAPGHVPVPSGVEKLSPFKEDSPVKPGASLASDREPGGGSERRVTHLFGGATAHDWLPPDSLHPDGRIVLVTSESKRREQAFAVDARRTVEVEAPATAPDAYATWTAHRPPRTIPNAIAPDAALVRDRYSYNSWANITHAGSFALPYAELDGSDYGVFGTTLWLEPLGKHVFVGLVSVSIPKFAEQTLGFLSYTNNQFLPSLTLNAYRYPSPARWYGAGLLVEDLVGGDLTATLPLDLTTAPFTSTSVDARVRYAYADPFDDSAFDDIETTGLVRPEAGYRSELRLGFTAKRQRPYRYNDVYPLDGIGLRARVTAGLPVLGSDAEFVRPDLAAYWVSPQLGIGRFYAYGRAQARFGDALAQDFVGLSRYDDIDLQLPFVEPITLSESERVRGYRRYAVGDRLVFGTLEYRLPPVFDLGTRLLGFLELGRVSPAFFVDAAAVWTGNDIDDAVRRTGVGFELKNRVSLGGFPLVHALGVAQEWDDLGRTVEWDAIDLYYRIQATLPF